MRLRVALMSSLAMTAVLMVAGPSQAADLDINNLPQVDDSTLASTVKDLTLPVRDLNLPEPKDLETKTTHGSEQVVTLNSDILFAFNKADLPPAASGKIAALVKDVPQKAKVSVGGHTDSLGTAARNATLSQERAAAVAAAINAARPDLVLTVKGFGSSQPVASNGTAAKDDPDGRAKNRRVEIRYAS
ncbi:hypothetical protein N802_05320 [Knoellia sinensis KCTC 19936]|uniref:OmpA-like domain-containing protein n=1 Tax=Knoellia sinensis KCTC 19936 TaxID=1385520 RepID=A0A0A0J629_9MICO|nr:OmpA family protein [Knoellia sinensis]KGN31026.1 hypothetical protein N802_05320 [Knoellia sinensis KCTC 19936]